MAVTNESVANNNNNASPVAMQENFDLPSINPTQGVETLQWDVEESSADSSTEGVKDNVINNDIGAIDLQNEAQVEALLDNNPQALARALNEIEPQRLNKNVEEQAEPILEQPTEIVDAPPVKPSISKQETQRKIAETESRLRAIMGADSTLPNSIKPVEKQAYQGVAEAQHDLAAIYTAGHGGVSQNFERAAFWFERAAESDIANASYNLGVLHHQGLGVDADIAKAMRFYKDAAANNHPEAQYNLGIAYIEGIGVEYDPVLASQYFESAANNGIMEAAYNLGLVYENGLLGRADTDQALIWYKRAADQGSVEASQALDQLAERMNVPSKEISRIADTVSATRDISSTASSTPTNDQAIIAQIQEYLMASGLYPGPADGLSGALTQDAIRAYQSANGLPGNGIPSEALLSHMLGNENTLGSR